MATSMIAETLDNSEHSTRLTPESQSYMHTPQEVTLLTCLNKEVKSEPDQALEHLGILSPLPFSLCGR
jgi:hypothetical protein